MKKVNKVQLLFLTALVGALLVSAAIYKANSYSEQETPTIKVIWENDEIDKENKNLDLQYRECLAVLGEWVVGHPGDTHDNCTKEHWYGSKDSDWFYSDRPLCDYPTCIKPKHIDKKYYQREGFKIEQGTRPDGVVVWRYVPTYYGGREVFYQR